MKIIKYLFLGLSVIAGFGSYNAFYIVEPGYTALHLRLGQVLDVHETSGSYFKMPLVDTIIYINNRICKKKIGQNALIFVWINFFEQFLNVLMQ